MANLTLNPWVSIWVQPRKTFAALSDFQRNHGVWVLSAICGFLTFVNLAQFYSLGLRLVLWQILFIAILTAPFLGYVYLTIASWIVFFTGKCLRGRSSFTSCRLALAWSYVPLTINVLTWVVLLLAFKERLFVNFPSNEVLKPSEIYFILGASVVQVAGAIWALVIYIHALAAVQGFTVSSSIANVVIATLLFLLFIFILWLLAIWLWLHLI